MNIKSIAITSVIVLMGIVLIQNTEVEGFKLLFWQVQMSRIILFPLLIFMGLIIGFLLGFLQRRRKDKIKEFISAR